MLEVAAHAGTFGVNVEGRLGGSGKMVSESDFGVNPVAQQKQASKKASENRPSSLSRLSNKIIGETTDGVKIQISLASFSLATVLNY